MCVYIYIIFKFIYLFIYSQNAGLTPTYISAKRCKYTESKMSKTGAVAAVQKLQLQLP